MIPVEDPPIPRNDTTPSIVAQAKYNGWEAGFYSFGQDDTLTWFNPGLVQRPDGLWLLARRAENIPDSPFGMNSVYAIKLDESGKKAIQGVRLTWEGQEEGQQFEDARGFYVPFMKQTGVSVCTFKWFGNNSWTGAIQALGFFDENWNCKVTHYVPFDTNATSLQTISKERFQKNWLFWMRDTTLTLLYKSDPWTVAEFGQNWSEQQVHVSMPARWAYGQIRGGTPPVLVDGKYYTFFHSSVSWRGNYRRYYVGAIRFSSEAPFEVEAVTPEPLLVGSQWDEWQHRKPPCVFPVGAILRDGKWLITAGINDLKAAWIELPHSDVLARLEGHQEAPLKLNPAYLTASHELNLLTGELEPRDIPAPLEPAPPKRKKGKRFKMRKQAKRTWTPEQRAAAGERLRLARLAKAAATC